MKKFINTAQTAVSEFLEGYVSASPSLALMEGHKVVLRSDFEAIRDSGKVVLISGGGSGHEPAHAGYVGYGMLTAAVCGEIFTSPSTDAILAALRTVTGSAGALLIVKNYTGDRLNFGLAAEIARLEGFRVEMVVVGDDAALVGEQTAGRRGLAGTVLVHKVAGAVAEAGSSLGEVRDMALNAANNVATMGIALRAPVLPGTERSSFDLANDEVEFGLGIHGEAGNSRERLMPVSRTVERLCSVVVADRQLAAGNTIAVMVNNLGATPPMELSIVAKEAIRVSQTYGLIIGRVWVGTFLTALDMAGCSITVMRLTSSLAGALDAPCDAPAWPGPGRSNGTVRRISATALKVPNTGHLRDPAGPQFSAGLAEAVAALQEAEPRLTELDRAAGDGDLGINLARGAAAVRGELQGLGAQHPAYALRDLSAIVRRTVGGTSGALYAAGLLRAGKYLEAYGSPGAPEWAEAMAEAAAAVSRLGDAQLGDCTMLDALIPGADALRAAVADGDCMPLRAAIEAAEKGAAATEALKARRGRTSYLGDRAIGTRDPGAEAVVVWLKAINRALKHCNLDPREQQG